MFYKNHTLLFMQQWGKLLILTVKAFTITYYNDIDITNVLNVHLQRTLNNGHTAPFSLCSRFPCVILFAPPFFGHNLTFPEE